MRVIGTRRPGILGLQFLPASLRFLDSEAAGTRCRNGENPSGYCDHRQRQNMMPALWGVSLAMAETGRLLPERLWRDL